MCVSNDTLLRHIQQKVQESTAEGILQGLNPSILTLFTLDNIAMPKYLPETRLLVDIVQLSRLCKPSLSMYKLLTPYPIKLTSQLEEGHIQHCHPCHLQTRRRSHLYQNVLTGELEQVQNLLVNLVPAFLQGHHMYTAFKIFNLHSLHMNLQTQQ